MVQPTVHVHVYTAKTVVCSKKVDIVPINRFVASATDGEGVVFIIQQFVSVNRVLITSLQDPTGLEREPWVIQRGEVERGEVERGEVEREEVEREEVERGEVGVERGGGEVERGEVERREVERGYVGAVQINNTPSMYKMYMYMYM